MANSNSFSLRPDWAKQFREIDYSKLSEEIMPEQEFNTAIWYQVCVYPNSFGFSVCNGIVLSAPNYKWIGKSIAEIKHNYLPKGCQVFKITEQLIPR